MAAMTAAQYTDLRRLRVAPLYLRGLGVEEIAQALAKKGLVGADGKAYGVAVIREDVEFWKQVWLEAVGQEPQAQRALLFAELNEVKRAAWAASDFRLVAACLKQQEELLMLKDAPPVREELFAFA